MNTVKLLLIALAIALVFLCVAAEGAPFLVSDPYVLQSDPNLNPTQFVA